MKGALARDVGSPRHDHLPGSYELIGNRSLANEKRQTITVGTTPKIVRWTP